ncbi:MAG: adenine phosphoribosyltransferase [Deltaproteobacteria bacterium]|nr:adenine phosphoribosyltransferase [Candidatus Anaeroferrophillacea bacterium]
MQRLQQIIRDIPDFPKNGIIFKDITTLLADAEAYQRVIDLMGHRYIGQRIDVVVGIEARGFIMGSALAYKLNTGVVLVRKAGKLPHDTLRETYALEYGTDTLEIHRDAVKQGQRVLIADDILATGGTVEAVIRMIRRLQGTIVECAFLAELKELEGRRRITDVPVFSLLTL